MTERNSTDPHPSSLSSSGQKFLEPPKNEKSGKRDRNLEIAVRSLWELSAQNQFTLFDLFLPPSLF